MTVVAVRSKAWVCGRLMGLRVRISPGCIYFYLPLVSVVCSQVEVSVSAWSLVQKSPTLPNVACLSVIVKLR